MQCVDFLHHFSYFHLAKLIFLLMTTPTPSLNLPLVIYSAYTLYEHMSSLGSNPRSHDHMIAYCYCNALLRETRNMTQIKGNNALKWKCPVVDRGATLVNAPLGRISGKWQMTYMVVLVGEHVGFTLCVYTLYCQKFWDACLYVHMNFNDIPFLIRRV